MKIYTRGGDGGETSLRGGLRVFKDAARVSCYGEVDELGAVLGLGRAQAGLDPELAGRVARVQAELFTLGAVLSDPSAAGRSPRLDADATGRLEQEIDAADLELPALRHFVLSGGSAGAAWLHLARATCRRVERAAVALSRAEPVDPSAVVYLNRLSDWLFTMARLANHRAGVGEIEWAGPASD